MNSQLTFMLTLPPRQNQKYKQIQMLEQNNPVLGSQIQNPQQVLNQIQLPKRKTQPTKVEWTKKIDLSSKSKGMALVFKSMERQLRVLLASMQESGFKMKRQETGTVSSLMVVSTKGMPRKVSSMVMEFTHGPPMKIEA